MTREEIIDELCRLRSDITNAGGYVNRTDVQKNRFAQALSEEIQRLQTEPCEDAISRQAVLDIVEFNRNSYDGNDAVVWIEKEIKELPSVQPEQKEITMEDVKAYCEPRNLVVLTKELFDIMYNSKEEKVKDEQG